MAESMELTNDEIQDILNTFNSKYDTEICELKPLQLETLSHFGSLSSDVVCMLPTGYGKSLVYELLPVFLGKTLNKSAFVIVLEPLNVIINQQMTKLGSDAVTIKNNMSEAELLLLQTCSYIYSHPENIIDNKEVYKILMSNSVQNKVCVIVVDEAHCIIDWGDEYRPKFKEIKQLRSVLPQAKILALSATLSKDGQKEISRQLLLKNVKVVSSKPTRDNVSLIVVTRPPLTTSVSTKETFDYVYIPLLCELKSKGQEFPLTLVYSSGNMDWVGYGFELAHKILGIDMFVGNLQEAQNQRVAMFHSCIEQGEMLKDIIFKNLMMSPEKSPLKLVFTTIALGMGADLRHVVRVIHVGPPKNLEAYSQQVGRAGRSGEQCVAVIFFNNSDLGRQGVSKSVKDYCKNDTECRKTVIDRYFGFTSGTDSLPNALCCDVCNTELKCNWQYETPLDEKKKCALRRAIQTYVQATSLENIVLPHHVEQLVFNALFYTESSTIDKDFSYPGMIPATLATIICQMLEQFN
ncbi:putative ATP-dependent DNA helicase RecS [Crassostrea virginica]